MDEQAFRRFATTDNVMDYLMHLFIDNLHVLILSSHIYRESEKWEQLNKNGLQYKGLPAGLYSLLWFVTSLLEIENSRSGAPKVINHDKKCELIEAPEQEAPPAAPLFCTEFVIFYEYGVPGIGGGDRRK